MSEPQESAEEVRGAHMGVDPEINASLPKNNSSFTLVLFLISKKFRHCAGPGSSTKGRVEENYRRGQEGSRWEQEFSEETTPDEGLSEKNSDQP